MRFFASAIAALAAFATFTNASHAMPFGDNYHEGIWHPTREDAKAFLGRSVAPEHLDAEVGDSYTMGAMGRGFVKETIAWAQNYLKGKEFPRSSDSKEYPYWRCFPTYIETAIPNGPEVQWSAPCFADSRAKLTTNTNGTYTLTLNLSKPTSLLCSDFYLFGTMEGLKLESFFFQGTQEITWTPAKTARPAQLYDVAHRGIRIFRFIEDDLTLAADLLDTALLFEPMATKKPSDEAAARNLDFLTKYAQKFKMPKRAIQSVPIDESLIHSGDFIGVIRLDGLDPMLAWAMGAATGHTTIAMRVGGELYIMESTTNGAYWPTNGIQKTPYKQWIVQAREAGYNLVWAPLTVEQRNRFNVSAAYEYFTSVEGVDYGYYNMLMAWIDTLKDNYPCVAPHYDMCLTQQHIELLLGVLDEIAPQIGDMLFGQAFNHRVGTHGLRLPEVLQIANEQGMTNLAELAPIVEDDEWLYDIKRYNDTVKAPSMVCCVFVCHMWKSGGLFDDVDREINCGEFTNADDYMMSILDTKFERPQQCVNADPENPLCQLEGEYSLNLLGHGSRDQSPHMAEKCPSMAPTYDKPLGC